MASEHRHDSLDNLYVAAGRLKYDGQLVAAPTCTTILSKAFDFVSDVIIKPEHHRCINSYDVSAHLVAKSYCPKLKLMVDDVICFNGIQSVSPSEIGIVEVSVNLVTCQGCRALIGNWYYGEAVGEPFWSAVSD